MRASNTVLPDVGTEACFPDVATNMWYHRYICAANKLGIASGFSNGKFKPNDPVTTLEALAFANKAFQTNIATTGEKWYELLQNFAHDNRLLPTHTYTTSTKISRGKSAELITRFQEFKRTNTPLNYKSTGCSVSSGTMSSEITLNIAEKERKFNLSLPSGYTNGREYSLVIATHGRTNSKDQVQKYMGLDK